jgi:hypothetical protein
VRSSAVAILKFHVYFSELLFVPDLPTISLWSWPFVEDCAQSPVYITLAGSRISSQIARSLPLDLSRQVARGVSVHARKQRNASVRQLAIRGRFGSQVSSMSLGFVGRTGANLPAKVPGGPSRYCVVKVLSVPYLVPKALLATIRK